MTDEQKRMKIQRALNSEFGHLNTTPAQRERLLALTVGGETVKQKPTFSFSGRSKLSLVTMVLLIVLCLSVTAYAVTVLINGYYERVAQMDADGSLIEWQLDDKIDFVNAMREYELTMNDEDYAIMSDAAQPEENRMAAADRIIYGRYGTLLEEETSGWLQQPDSITDISPDAHIIFLERYLAEHPEGITTKEQRQQFNDALGYYLRDVYYPAFREAYKEQPETTPPPKGSREDAIQSLRNRMTEVYGWDPVAVETIVPQIEWDEEYQMWTVSGEVSAASMENCFEPSLEGAGITKTETGYMLTILVDSKGNTTADTDKDAFRAEHANDVEAQYRLSNAEGNELAKATIMEKFGITEAELSKLFCISDFAGKESDGAGLLRYVFYPHYGSKEDPQFIAVVNLVTGEVSEVFSYQEAYNTPEWQLIFFAAQTERDHGWYDRWPVEKKQELLGYMKDCGLLPEHAVWQQTEPDEAQIDAFAVEAFETQGYTTAINTMRMIHTLFGSEMDLWAERDVLLFNELRTKFHGMSESNALATLNVSSEEIDEASAIRLVRTAFCDAWQLPYATLDTWQIEAQLMHDDDLDRGLVYYRVFLTCPDEESNAFYGRRNFNYRVLVDGTIMDASMMSRWYSPAQEKAVLDEQQLFDNDTYQKFLRYAQQNVLLMEYGDFFHWPLEHKKACADQLRPVVLERMANDANYVDPRLIAFAGHVYGLPDDAMQTEQEAVAAAQKLLEPTFHLTDHERTMMKPEIVLLDVTNPDAPFWQISFSAEDVATSAQRIGLQPTIYYTIEIHAHTGECLNSYTFGVDDGQTGVDAWDRWY